MTTTDPTSPASMGEPLSEAELGDAELEWIRDAYAKSQTVVHGIRGDRTGPYAKDSGATAIRDVGRLLAEMDRRKAWLHDELVELLRKHDTEVSNLKRVIESTRKRRDDYSRKLIGWREAAEKSAAERDAATSQVGVLEGQLATAQAEVVIRDGAIVGRDKAIDSLEAWHRNWKPLVDAHMKRCSGCDACDSEDGDHV